MWVGYGGFLFVVRLSCRSGTGGCMFMRVVRRVLCTTSGVRLWKGDDVDVVCCLIFWVGRMYGVVSYLVGNAWTKA